MRPLLDISKQKSFTVWESGFWNKDRNFGSAIITADAKGDKLNVVFDHPPTKGIRHALFYANAGNILAGCYVRAQGGFFNYQLDLERITELYTENVQGHPVPRYKSDMLWASRQKVLRSTEDNELLSSLPTFPSVPNAHTLMEMVIKKALMPLEDQKIFWGEPRPQTGTVEEWE